MQAVSEHEREHADNGIRAAKAIQDRVSALESAPTCQVLGDSINSTAKALIGEHRKADMEYDRLARGVVVFQTETEDDNRAAWIASRGAVPLRVPSPDGAGVELTDTDRKRLAGTAEFESDMTQLSAKADRADVAWRRYVGGCRLEITRVSAGAVIGGRDWFGYAWTSANSTRPTEACAEAGTFYAIVGQVKDEMCVAEERARRSSVHPGARRDLRTKYRLDWDGWDRVCR